jgi:hypothetical protein
MTADINTPARRPLPNAQLDAVLRGVLGSPTLSRAQRERHLRRLLLADVPASRRTWSTPAIEVDARPSRRVPAAEPPAMPARRGRLRQAAGFMAAMLALTLVAGLLAAVFGAGTENRLQDGGPASPPAWDGQLYAFHDGDVAVIDSQTGTLTRTLGAQIGSQSPFLAVDAASGRVAVADFLRDRDSVTFGVMIYRMSDGGLEQEIPVPTLIRYLGSGAGIALSPGGQYLIVYQYETPPDGNGDNARYWLGVWDLNSGEHVREVPLAGCPVVTQLVAPTPERLFLLCGDHGEVVDLARGKLVGAFGPNAGDAAILIRDGRLYEVSPSWHAQFTPLDGSSGAREYTGLAANLPGLVAAPLAIGLDPTGQYLYVPAGAPDAIGPTAIVVIDLRSGRPSRVIQLGQPFREIAFAPDASAAFVTLTDADGAVTSLARIDLTLGRPTWQNAGVFGSVTAVAP